MARLRHLVMVTSVPPPAASQPMAETGPLHLGSQSCEQLATRITEAILDHHGWHRSIRYTVLEDGILGAGVAWQPEPPQ